MGDFENLYSELTGVIPQLDSLYARRLINRAWARVRDFRLWSFQVVADAQLFVPFAISAGNVSVTFNSTTVTASSGAAAAFNAVAFGPPPLASPILGVGRQLRVGASSPGLAEPTGPNYNIVAWDGVNTLTIDKPYGESTTPNSNYQVLKCYYGPPALPYTSTNEDVNWIKYLSITNRLDGYTISGRKLYYTQAQLNVMDPQRGGQGDTYIVAAYMRNQLGQPVVEFYPNPVNAATYGATLVTRWPDLSEDQDLPQMPYELYDCVIAQAQVLAGNWASANVGRHPQLAGSNWVNFSNMKNVEFKESLLQCLKMDNEMMPNLPFMPGGGFDFPLGGQFLQNHDISSFIP